MTVIPCALAVPFLLIAGCKARKIENNQNLENSYGESKLGIKSKKLAFSTESLVLGGSNQTIADFLARRTLNLNTHSLKVENHEVLNLVF